MCLTSVNNDVKPIKYGYTVLDKFDKYLGGAFSSIYMDRSTEYFFNEQTFALRMQCADDLGFKYTTGYHCWHVKRDAIRFLKWYFKYQCRNERLVVVYCKVGGTKVAGYNVVCYTSANTKEHLGKVTVSSERTILKEVYQKEVE